MEGQPGEDIAGSPAGEDSLLGTAEVVEGFVEEDSSIDPAEAAAEERTDCNPE